MAWNAPATVVAGQLMTAVFWNAYVRDNFVALRAGGIAIASQAAGDLVLGSSATQWKRVAGVEGRVARRVAGVWTTSSLVDLVYPVGSIYRSVLPTSPATFLGGTWAAFGTGRTLVGIDAGQTEFDTVEETGGATTHTLSTAEMPAHAHGVNDPTHAHLVGYLNDPVGFTSTQRSTEDNYPGVTGSNLSTLVATGITIQNAGSGAAHSNMQPYVTCYMWKRTA